MASRLIRVAGLIALVATLSAPEASAFRYDPPGQFTSPGAVEIASSGVHVIRCQNGIVRAVGFYRGNPCHRHGR